MHLRDPSRAAPDRVPTTLPTFRFVTAVRGWSRDRLPQRNAGDLHDIIVDDCRHQLGGRHVDGGLNPNNYSRHLQAALGPQAAPAIIESFNSTLKTELIYRTIFLTRGSARISIAEWIERFYNRRRRHSTLGYATPSEFEECFYSLLQGNAKDVAP